jgi:hypothetical protein
MHGFCWFFTQLVSICIWSVNDEYEVVSHCEVEISRWCGQWTRLELSRLNGLVFELEILSFLNHFDCGTNVEPIFFKIIIDCPIVYLR